MAVIVLLGAGASFGSKKALPHTPPLGNKLFDDLTARGGIAARLPKEIQNIFKSNFEEGMLEYYKMSDGNIMTFQRELAHYLAEFSPLPDNIYIKLINTLNRSRVIYSSLNYDLLFEISAGHCNLNTYYTSQNHTDGVRLLKIHGSSNFWPDIQTGSFVGCTFMGSGRADIQAPIRPLNQQQTIYKCLQEDSVAPAIAMFAPGKQVKISPDYVENQYRMWLEAVKKASKIFIVGVRVHEVDTHIWGELGKIKGSVHYFGFENDKHEFTQWKASSVKDNAFFHESDFENAVEIISKTYKKT